MYDRDGYDINSSINVTETDILMADKLKVLIICSEAVPFAKTGGLADVAGALPAALRHLGVDARLVLPSVIKGISREGDRLQKIGRRT